MRKFLRVNNETLLKTGKFREKKQELDFVWTDYQRVIRKVEEELNEVRETLKKDKSERVQDELGDLQAVLELINFLGYSETETLEQSLDKLENRLNKVEILIQQDGLKTLKGLSRNEKLAYWQRAKESEQD